MRGNVTRYARNKYEKIWADCGLPIFPGLRPKISVATAVLPDFVSLPGMLDFRQTLTLLQFHDQSLSRSLWLRTFARILLEYGIELGPSKVAPCECPWCSRLLLADLCTLWALLKCFYQSTLICQSSVQLQWFNPRQGRLRCRKEG